MNAKLLVAGVAVAMAGAALGGCAVQDKSATSQYGIDAKVTALSVTTKGGDIDVLAGDGPARGSRRRSVTPTTSPAPSTP